MLNLLFPFMWIHWACLFAIIEVYNHKIIPVFLTMFSTVLGLVPFLIDGSEDEAFWFSFAIGKSGGLLFFHPGLDFRHAHFHALETTGKEKGGFIGDSFVSRLILITFVF